MTEQRHALQRDPVPVIEIGGTHALAALVDPVAGHVVRGSTRRAALPAHGSAAEIIGGVLECAGGLAARPGACWAVAVPGPFDYERGVALFEGVGKFESLYGVDVRRALLDGIGARPSAVMFLNDADAFLLGEWRFGAARGLGRCVGVTLGTGVGSAFLADGVIVANGLDVPPEGRVDLLRVGDRPIEDTVSRRAIRAAYAARTGVNAELAPDVVDIASLARTGDMVAAETLHVAFAALGVALAPWLTSFGAEGAVVGGSMVGSWDLVGPSLASGVAAGTAPGHRSAVVPRPAARPTDAALLGAAYLAYQVGRGPE